MVNHRGLDWLKGTVEPIRVPQDSGLKIPHMGWNELYFSDRAASHPVLAGLHNRDHAYFVHSYYFRPEDPETVLASVDYGGPVTAIVGRDNIIGNAIPSGKEPGGGTSPAGEFPWVDPVTGLLEV